MVDLDQYSVEELSQLKTAIAEKLAESVDTKKVVVNHCYGGFELSPAGLRRYVELKGEQIFFYRETPNNTYIKVSGAEENRFSVSGFSVDMGEIVSAKDSKELWKHHVSTMYMDRDDPALVQTVEELGEKANSNYSNLAVVEIPAGIDWHIEEYDGYEHIAEDHNTW